MSMQPKNDANVEYIYLMSRCLVLFLCFLLFSFVLKEPSKTELSLRLIPRQTFDPWQVLQSPKGSDTISVDSFEVSSFITLGEYKSFLFEMRRDSGESYYVKLLPDSGMCTPSLYNAYFTTRKYDRFPVCGVSWINACRYCDWRSLMEVGKDSLHYIYRLPHLREWLSAYRYFTTNKLSSDLNANYSDWVLEAMDETSFSFSNKHDVFADVDYTYPDNPNDYPVLRRKRIMGNSFHLQHHCLNDFIGEYAYSFEGYTYVSFRVVRTRGEELYGWKWRDRIKAKQK